MIVQAPKLQKTTADFVVIGISPVLIMALVGSLVFFLTAVFYRGEAPLAIRWVLFWFVIAIVLVSRMGIEQGPAHATGYGLALAGATWLYLAFSHKEYFIGLVLLAITWWCANRLTRDCTLVDDEEDSTEEGVLDAVSSLQEKGSTRRDLSRFASQQKERAGSAAQVKQGRAEETPGLVAKRKNAKRNSPGVWVVYFSLGALPLFAVGQVILPPQDTLTRRFAFLYVAVYLTAALGLLLTTSFLTLRRYLRQRRLRMPGNVGLRWFGSGLAVVFFVLAAALVLPRPGSDYSWKTLAAAVDASLQGISESLAEGGSEEAQPDEATEGSESAETGDAESGESDSANDQSGEQEGNAGSSGGTDEAHPGSASEPSSGSMVKIEKLHNAFRAVVIIVGIALVLWSLWKGRHAIREFVRSLIEQLKQFLQAFRFPRRSRFRTRSRSRIPQWNELFESPFQSGEDQVWPPERLVIHTYRAVEAWARRRGFLSGPERTANELCRRIAESNPDLETALQSLSYYYGNVAYGRRLPSDYDSHPLRAIWGLLEMEQGKFFNGKSRTWD